MTVKDETRIKPELSTAQRALLEERLQRARHTNQRAAANRTSIPRRSGGNELPLSFAQERLWFLDQLEPGSPVYNVCQGIRLRGPLDLAALEQALNAIIRRHEILRTNFHAKEGCPLQVIAPERRLTLACEDLSEWPRASVEEELRRRLREASREPFHFESDLLIRARVVKVAAEDHTLLVAMHHIISDGWSLGILCQELSALYSAFHDGREPDLGELPLQFGDFVLWERENVQGAGLERSLRFWKERLGGSLPVLELPLDRPRSAATHSTGAVETMTLDAGLGQALKALGQEQGATLFMTLLAGFQIMLSRWTGQEDVVVGSVVAGRRKVELEKLIGFFVNTLVFRTDLSGGPSVREALARARDTALAALAHQELPFDVLVKELRPDRAASRNPLFQVLFVLQNAPMSPADLPGLGVETLDVDTGTAKFDLTLSMIESPDGLRAGFEYNADLFERETIVRMMQCFRTVLEGMAANPDASIVSLPLLGVTETHRVLHEWNATATDFPRELTVSERFEAQVQSRPEAVALTFGAVRLTYAELNVRANRLAHRLRAWGVGPDRLVALCLERSPEMIVALLGILKAGGAYVSLDPAYPAERLAFMLADAQAPVILTTQALRSVLPPASDATVSARILCLDTEWRGLEQESAENPRSQSTANDLAYVSYTSGSTGRPKGVGVPHRAICRLLLHTDYVTLGPDDVVAQLANCAFDASTFEIWGALLHGGRLVIVPPSVVLAPAEFRALLVHEGVTAMFVTTALFNQLAESRPDFFRPLRHVLFGGEAVNPNTVRAVLRAGAPERLLHVYGPTETTTFATWFEVRTVAPDAVTIPIGRPLANTTCYVLDAHRQPVPAGVPGELYIGGPGVARGYWRRPELDAERFVPDPFGGDSAGRLYRTGDRARWRSDGTIEFLGRLDRQVKIRGFRIEPGEIEVVLERHPHVQQCVIDVRPAGNGERQLVAYVVAEGQPPQTQELRQHLQGALPDYMVPTLYMFLEELPLTANGKVDRAALPAPSERSADVHCAPRDDTERELAEIWAGVLGVERVGVRDRFFDLGGHSLLAVQMVARIEKRFGRKLPVAAIFQHGTIEELAPMLRSESPAYSAGSSIVAIHEGGARPPLYFVHGVGGGMFWGYSNLARYLGAAQPTYAFKSRGLDGQPEWATIEEMAANYVADLKARQPQGPYWLGGYCFGGVVAYEMARLLEAQGDQVTLLALINCSPPNTDYERAPERGTWGWRLKFSRNLAFWAGCLAFRWSVAEKVEFFRWKFRLLRKRAVGPWLQSARALSVTDVDEMVNLEAYSEEQRRLWQTHVRALRQYQPKPYGGGVTLLRTRGHPLVCSFDERYGWAPLARGGVKVRIVPGGHGNILDEPHVQTVARELGRELEQLAGDSARAVGASVDGERVSA